MTKTYFENKRGIKVTETSLSTRYKDEALAPIQSVQIGREPLFMALITGIGLIGFCYQFGDLLYFSEQLTFAALGIVILFAGYAIAALQVGQYMHEKTVYWGTIWEMQKVRRAIAEAKDEAKGKSVNRVVDMDADG